MTRLPPLHIKDRRTELYLHFDARVEAAGRQTETVVALPGDNGCGIREADWARVRQGFTGITAAPAGGRPLSLYLVALALRTQKDRLFVMDGEGAWTRRRPLIPATVAHISRRNGPCCRVPTPLPPDVPAEKP